MYCRTISESSILHVHNDSTSDLNETVHLKASFDCSWQKRGNGRAYNSLSGLLIYLSYTHIRPLQLLFLFEQNFLYK